MKKQIIINIPQPCEEDWQQMTPDSNGRYCSHCQKSVVDFTGFSDEQLYRFLLKKNEHVCGRFLGHQLDRTIELSQQPRKLYRMTAALGFTLLFMQGCDLNKSHPPLITAALGNFSKPVRGGEITGTARSQHFGVILPNVEVELKNFDTADHIVRRCVTDGFGKFRFSGLGPGTYTVCPAEQLTNVFSELWFPFGVEIKEQEIVDLDYPADLDSTHRSCFAIEDSIKARHDRENGVNLKDSGGLIVGHSGGFSIQVISLKDYRRIK